jgi:hypothetical protein
MELDNTQAQETQDVAQTQSPKTYTQDEINGIVQERLSRERKKYEDYDSLKEKAAKFDELEEANKSELQKAQDKAAELEAKLAEIEKEKTINEMRNKVAQEKGVPAELLIGDTEEACTTQADGILNFSRINGYPSVKDAGESNVVNKTSTKEQFKEWANKQLNNSN